MIRGSSWWWRSSQRTVGTWFCPGASLMNCSVELTVDGSTPHATYSKRTRKWSVLTGSSNPPDFLALLWRASEQLQNLRTAGRIRAGEEEIHATLICCFYPLDKQRTLVCCRFIYKLFEYFKLKFTGGVPHGSVFGSQNFSDPAVEWS